MKNPVNDMPSHPDLDGMTRDEIEEYIELAPHGTISDEVYDIAYEISMWLHSPMRVGFSYGPNTKGGAVPIGSIRQQGKHFNLGSRRIHVANAKGTGFRVCRSKS